MGPWWNYAATTSEAFVPHSLAPGEAYLFGWYHAVVPVNGAAVTVKWD